LIILYLVSRSLQGYFFVLQGNFSDCCS